MYGSKYSNIVPYSGYLECSGIAVTSRTLTSASSRRCSSLSLTEQLASKTIICPKWIVIEMYNRQHSVLFVYDKLNEFCVYFFEAVVYDHIFTSSSDS